MPERIQLKRTKGWRKPPNTIVVSRPSKWGNPFLITEDRTRFDVVIAFHAWLFAKIEMFDEEKRQWILDHAHELRGKNLACWCPLGEPCHADVLLKLAKENS